MSYNPPFELDCELTDSAESGQGCRYKQFFLWCFISYLAPQGREGRGREERMGWMDVVPAVEGRCWSTSNRVDEVVMEKGMGEGGES
jgi:hypothetical protein